MYTHFTVRKCKSSRYQMHFKKLKCNNIVLTGGCFLNVVVNYKLLKEFPDLNFYVDPISFDGGTAIGAAYIIHHNPKIKSF